MSTFTRARFVLLVPFVLVACETSRSDKPTPPAPSETAPALPSAPASVPSGKTSSTAPAPSASAAAAEEKGGSLVGTFEGRYDAKRGEVEIPPKVKDKVRTKDDGKTATGVGKISITIDPDGEVSGSLSGALGAATLKGKAEGESISAMVNPEDGLAPQAMFGIVSGKLESGHIK